MTSAVEDVIRSLRRRRDELEALIAEHQEIVAALEAIEGTHTKDASHRSPGSRKASPRRRRRRQARRGERREQILAILRDEPTAKARQIADKLGTTPQNVYQQLRLLEQKGVLRRGKQGYVVKS